MRLISFCQAQLQLLLTGSWDSINVNFSTQPPHTQPHLLTWLSKFWSLDPTFDFFSVHLYFDLLIWKMLHDILPTRERMNRMNLPGVPSAVCTLCDGNAADTSEHALLTCSYIRVGAENPSASSSTWRSNYVCGLNFVDFRSEDLYHMTFHTASILDHLWASRRKYVHGRQYAPKWNHRSCSWEKEDWPSLQIKSISCLRQHLPSLLIHNWIM